MKCGESGSFFQLPHRPEMPSRRQAGMGHFWVKSNLTIFPRTCIGRSPTMTHDAVAIMALSDLAARVEPFWPHGPALVAIGRQQGLRDLQWISVAIVDKGDRSFWTLLRRLNHPVFRVGCFLKSAESSRMAQRTKAVERHFVGCQ
ncbi:hypothetical protein AAGS40_02845 [Paraburkholderia sp. PREW-6R]|uniref:hypothetical protein n=1 Tax=Paraburkholderia sp. PREW-6R TaxID=3141544 RepID=UPI0031F5AA57